MTSPWLEARNLLVVRLDNAGDLVMLGPALRAIRASSPATRLTLLATSAGAAVAPLLPWVDDVIVWRPIWQELGGQAGDPGRDRSLIDLLAARGFDGAIVFTSFRQDPHVPAYVCYLAGIPLRAGASKEFGGATLTHELASGPDAAHQVDRNLDLVERLGFAARDRRLGLAITDQDRARAEELLREAGVPSGIPLVLIHPGASAAARRYPSERYADVARGLAERGLGVVVSGSEREAEAVAVVSGHGRLPALAGRTTLAEYAAVVERADAVVCGNTLPLHVAEAMGTPVVALYAGTDLESQWAPRAVPSRLLRVDTPCYPCYLIDCPIGQPCLAIAPEQVVDAVVGLLGGAAGRHALSLSVVEAAW